MNFIDELSKYYKVWSREFSSDAIHKFTKPETAIFILQDGAWLPQLSDSSRVCATDKTVLTTFSYNVTTSIVFKKELFYYLDYLRAFVQISKHGTWASPNGRIFWDDTMMPWESEFYSTNPVTVDSIDKVIIYLRTREDLGLAEVVLLREKCKELGIKVEIDIRKVTDALAIPCACEIFENSYQLCEHFDLITIKNYPQKILWYNSPLTLDFCWLVDYEHGREHLEPNYEYDSRLSNEITSCIRNFTEFYVTRLNSVTEKNTKGSINIMKLRRLINMYFNDFWEIYFGERAFE